MMMPKAEAMAAGIYFNQDCRDGFKDSTFFLVGPSQVPSWWIKTLPRKPRLPTSSTRAAAAYPSASRYARLGRTRTVDLQNGCCTNSTCRGLYPFKLSVHHRHEVRGADQGGRRRASPSWGPTPSRPLKRLGVGSGLSLFYPIDPYRLGVRLLSEVGPQGFVVRFASEQSVEDVVHVDENSEVVAIDVLPVS
jgi:hypothetical protein